jgi:IPT/TIG domain/FG-GAP repeat
MTGRMGLLAYGAVPWRRAIVGGLLFVLLGVLARGLTAERSASSTAATRVARGSSSRLSSLPATAQAPVSAALGSADPGYLVKRSSGGLQAVNAEQRLRARFERSSVLLSSGAASMTLGLVGVGYGSSLQTAGDVLSHADANRVAYTGEGLSEWYANGPLGLEQGFTIAAAPAGRPAGALTLALSLSGDVRAAASPGGASVLISGDRSSLRYGDLLATDAQGRTLHSWLAVSAGRILLRIDTNGARYPLRIDPLLQQAKLTGGAEESGEGRFAASVALSADGDTALIGAPGDDNGAGAAWVFTRSGSSWTQQGAKLTGAEAGSGGAAECEIEEAGEEAGECSFGKSVALSGNGETALVGGPGADENLGAVWVFTHSESGWTQQGPALMGGNEQLKGHFGRSLALSSDGNTALIGAPGDAGYAGAAWVFTRAGTSWSEQVKIAPPESGAIAFGRSVALSGDGATALIGAPAATGRAGAAWAFANDEGTGWTQQARLAAGAGNGEGRFGFSVALSADAGTALVGERTREDSDGAAWVFTHQGESWSEPEKLAGGEVGDESRFGYSVALSADGSSALVGDPGHGGSIGAAWLFTRAGASYGAGEALTATGEHGSGQLGADVALSASGEAALLGAPGASDRTGAAWAFVVPGAPPQVTGVSPSEGPTSGGTEVTISGSDFSEATAVKFGSVPAQSFTVNSEGTSITAESPKEPAGTVDVKVESPGATSATSEQDLFTFVAPARKTGKREAGGETETESTRPGVVGPGSSGGSGSPVGQSAVLAFSSGTSPACAVTLLGKSITVRSHGRAALKLSWKGQAGSVTCKVKLTLALEVRLAGTRKKRYKTVVLGAGSFTIVSAKTKLVLVKLNAHGRSRLSTAHGRLAARLTILVSSPAPRRTQTSAIRLVLQRARTTPRRST